MRKIPNRPIISPFTGQPYVDVRPGSAAGEEPATPPPLTPSRAVRAFLERAYEPPQPPPSFKDARQAMRILRALDEQKDADELGLEDADAEWLEAALKERGPAVFRLNLGPVYEAVFGS